VPVVESEALRGAADEAAWQASIEPREALGPDDFGGCIEGAVVVFIFSRVFGVFFRLGLELGSDSVWILGTNLQADSALLVTYYPPVYRIKQ
jgi:hypothetical protein